MEKNIKHSGEVQKVLTVDIVRIGLSLSRCGTGLQVINRKPASLLVL